MDHANNTVRVYVFGRRKDRVLTELKALLSAFDIRCYDTDDGGLMNVTWTPSSTG